MELENWQCWKCLHHPQILQDRHFRGVGGPGKRKEPIVNLAPAQPCVVHASEGLVTFTHAWDVLRVEETYKAGAQFLYSSPLSFLFFSPQTRLHEPFRPIHQTLISCLFEGI